MGEFDITQVRKMIIKDALTGFRIIQNLRILGYDHPNDYDISIDYVLNCHVFKTHNEKLFNLVMLKYS